jgi:hypothetical protein
MADKLAKQFPRPSANTQYKDDFKKKKEQEEGKPLHVDYKNEEPYNNPLTEEQLDEALAGFAGSSPGPDHMHYDLIKKMARTEKLLEVYEHIWKTGAFPIEWTEAIVIPILKPGKDAKQSENYRVISLTSCLWKIMERMVNKRLVHVLDEKTSYLSNNMGSEKLGSQKMY